MSTVLEELRHGCLNYAMDDEPIFVFLGRDPSAPRIIREWADQRVKEINDRRRPHSDMAKVMQARAAAKQMEEWRDKNDGAWRNGLFKQEC